MAAQTPEGACLLSRAPSPKGRSRVALELYVSPAMAPICRDAIDAYHPAGVGSSPSGEVTLLVGSLEESGWIPSPATPAEQQPRS